ncbi:MAG: hypothetical protein AAB428_03380 [Patescibacteria group bacterium]
MMNDWNDVILPKKEPVFKKEVLKTAKKIAKYETIISPLFPELKKAARPVVNIIEPRHLPQVGKVLPIAPSESSLPKKTFLPLPTTSPFGAVSPYISKLPILWTRDFGSKLATLALAIAVSFGVYSYSGHILNLGFGKTVAATASSLARTADQIYDRLALFLNIKNQKEEQLASPSVFMNGGK